MHADDLLERHGPQPLGVVIPEITLRHGRQPVQLVEADVRPTPHPGVPQPRSLQPPSPEQPVDKLPKPPFLQLTPPLRINPFSIRLDEGHNLDVSDHAVGVARAAGRREEATRLQGRRRRQVSCYKHKGL